MHRKKGLTSKIRGGAMTMNTNQGMQEMTKHGRKSRGLTGRGRKVRKIGSARM